MRWGGVWGNVMWGEVRWNNLGEVGWGMLRWGLVWCGGDVYADVLFMLLCKY